YPPPSVATIFWTDGRMRLSAHGPCHAQPPSKRPTEALPGRPLDTIARMPTHVRDATEDDLPGIAEVSVASDTDSGTDVEYVRHLMHDGTVAVAIANGRPIGFAAALPVGGVTMLADLFVRPDAQSAGAGRRLLDHVFAGSTNRMTCASHDPRAIALYTRA